MKTILCLVSSALIILASCSEVEPEDTSGLITVMINFMEDPANGVVVGPENKLYTYAQFNYNSNDDYTIRNYDVVKSTDKNPGVVTFSVDVYDLPVYIMVHYDYNGDGYCRWEPVTTYKASHVNTTVEINLTTY